MPLQIPNPSFLGGHLGATSSRHVPEALMLCCRNACIIVLSSGYSIGFLAAVVLHLLLPMEAAATKDVTDVKAGLYDPTAPR